MLMSKFISAALFIGLPWALGTPWASWQALQGVWAVTT
jgi:hypothetical protein